MSKVIGIRTDEGNEWHAPGVVHDYATLCGMDGDDSVVGQHGHIEPKRGQKITCGQCLTIFRRFKELRLLERDFA